MPRLELAAIEMNRRDQSTPIARDFEHHKSPGNVNRV
jgi:hypothetical protein